jgi:hypothetical protein
MRMDGTSINGPGSPMAETTMKNAPARPTIVAISIAYKLLCG